MTEEIANYDLSKLAEDKGFNWGTLAFYFRDSKQITNDRLGKLGSYDSSSRNPGYCDAKDVLAAPTLSLLAKWLREKHNLHVQVENNNYNKSGDWCFDICRLPSGIPIMWSKGDPTYSSYEDALEQGLLKALKLIENEKD